MRLTALRSHWPLLRSPSHPDKIRLGPNETREDVDNKFVELTKAYKSLTDEAVRENLKLYGNPDGPSQREDVVAIPKWIVEGSNGGWVLAVYGLVFGGLMPWFVVRPPSTFDQPALFPTPLTPPIPMLLVWDARRASGGSARAATQRKASSTRPRRPSSAGSTKTPRMPTSSRSLPRPRNSRRRLPSWPGRTRPRSRRRPRPSSAGARRSSRPKRASSALERAARTAGSR
jgi:hypothetical protein